MGRAFFLIVSKSATNEPSFTQELAALVYDKFDVTILLAMPNVDDVWQTKRILIKNNPRMVMDRVNVITLTDIYADKKGVALKGELTKLTSLNNLQSIESHEGDAVITRFIGADGAIVAETLSQDNVKLRTTFFDGDSRITQVDSYAANELVGIEKFADDFLKESLLLNKASQLVVRFTNSDQNVKIKYRVGLTSVLSIPQDSVSMTEQENQKTINNLEGDTHSTLTEVIDYDNYQRYNDINAFYYQILEEVVDSDTRIYLDMRQVVQESKYLSGKLIFNY